MNTMVIRIPITAGLTVPLRTEQFSGLESERRSFSANCGLTPVAVTAYSTIGIDTRLLECKDVLRRSVAFHSDFSNGYQAPSSVWQSVQVHDQSSAREMTSRTRWSLVFVMPIPTIVSTRERASRLEFACTVDIEPS